MADSKNTGDSSAGESEDNRLVVDDFIVRVAADSVSEGPFTYIGKDLKSAYAGRGITNAEFDALVGDLVTTLNKLTSVRIPNQRAQALLTGYHKEDFG